MFDYFGYLDTFSRMSALLWGGYDVVLFGRRYPHPRYSDHKKKGSRAKAKRRARSKHRRK